MATFYFQVRDTTMDGAETVVEVAPNSAPTQTDEFRNRTSYIPPLSDVHTCGKCPLSSQTFGTRPVWISSADPVFVPGDVLHHF